MAAVLPLVLHFTGITEPSSPVLIIKVPCLPSSSYYSFSATLLFESFLNLNGLPSFTEIGNTSLEDWGCGYKHEPFLLKHAASVACGHQEIGLVCCVSPGF